MGSAPCEPAAQQTAPCGRNGHVRPDLCREAAPAPQLRVRVDCASEAALQSQQARAAAWPCQASRCSRRAGLRFGWVARQNSLRSGRFNAVAIGARAVLGFRPTSAGATRMLADHRLASSVRVTFRGVRERSQMQSVLAIDYCSRRRRLAFAIKCHGPIACCLQKNPDFNRCGSFSC